MFEQNAHCAATFECILFSGLVGIWNPGKLTGGVRNSQQGKARQDFLPCGMGEWELVLEGSIIVMAIAQGENSGEVFSWTTDRTSLGESATSLDVALTWVG